MATSPSCLSEKSQRIAWFRCVTVTMTTLVDETTQTPTEPGVINGGLRPRRTETPTRSSSFRSTPSMVPEEGRGRGRTIVIPMVEMHGMGGVRLGPARGRLRHERREAQAHQDRKRDSEEPASPGKRDQGLQALAP